VSVVQDLAKFQETESQDAFSLQSSKLLKVELSDVTIQAKLGSMAAYQGDVRFEHAGSGGLSRMVKKAVTSEGTQLMKVSGTGEVFLADLAQEIHILRLDDDFITCNGANVLAFEDGIDWDIKRVEGLSGLLSGGLTNMELRGSGMVALVSDGTPMLLQVDEHPTYADPSCAITWSSGVRSEVKTDVNLKSLIGKGSGEGLQLAFSGSGWVLIQPSEGPVAGATGASGGGSAQNTQGSALGQLGGLLGR
jgi:uncharacterized protein (AIM24 family)